MTSAYARVSLWWYLLDLGLVQCFFYLAAKVWVHLCELVDGSLLDEGFGHLQLSNNVFYQSGTLSI